MVAGSRKKGKPLRLDRCLGTVDQWINRGSVIHLGGHAGFGLCLGLGWWGESHRLGNGRLEEIMKSEKPNPFLAQKAVPGEVVAYQPGAVVSREILKKGTGTVTLFAFDEGQGLSEHTAPFDALVYVLEGEVDIRIAGSPHRLKGGEMIIMPAQQPHALTAVKPFKMVLTMIRS